MAVVMMMIMITRMFSASGFREKVVDNFRLGLSYKKLTHFIDNTMCFKKIFTTLKAYINLFRGHVQCFQLS
jgi:hypothetical protein